jgi:dehydro coenzyme F420 reductase / coenzyme F420-0:L-glutamate ligase / coenzyme F420-1:gamma-L-glutamate ligase
VSLLVLPIEGLPTFEPGDDLAGILAPRLREAGLLDGDVVVVTSKVVSKVEGRLLPGDDREEAVATETRRVVARRGELVIAETRHGFVCANAGVDASNLASGTIALLPLDPDGSAERLRRALRELTAADAAVVITDTFGRAWRTGLVNVAIGCAGLPSLVDLRGTHDHDGRTLEATIVALADEVAAASGLVMPKAGRIPAAIVRGVDRAGAPVSPAAAMLRPPDEDLFRTSPLQAILARRAAVAFEDAAIPRDAVESALEASLASAAPGARSWRIDVVVAAEAGAELRDVTPGLPEAPIYLVPTPDGAVDDDTLLGVGAAVQTLMSALDAQGISSAWTRAGDRGPRFGVVAAGRAAPVDRRIVR